MTLKVALLGLGKVGKEIQKTATLEGHETLSKKEWDKADVWIDFSHPSLVESHVKASLSLKKPLVIGTTGWDEIRPSMIELVKRENGSVLFAPNFSIGVYFFFQTLQAAKKLYLSSPEYDVSGVEIHHKTKLDSPSGTALAISEIFDNKFSFASARVGHAPGTHTVIFDSTFDTITLTHDSKNRTGFAKGALLAAKWLINKKGWFTLDDVFRSLHSSHHSL